MPLAPTAEPVSAQVVGGLDVVVEGVVVELEPVTVVVDPDPVAVVVELEPAAVVAPLGGGFAVVVPADADAPAVAALVGAEVQDSVGEVGVAVTLGVVIIAPAPGAAPTPVGGRVVVTLVVSVRPGGAEAAGVLTAVTVTGTTRAGVVLAAGVGLRVVAFSAARWTTRGASWTPRRRETSGLPAGVMTAAESGVPRRSRVCRTF